MPRSLRRGLHVCEVSGYTPGMYPGDFVGWKFVMSIVVDPAVSGEELQRQLYAGDLVILTRLQALREFVDYTRKELAELFWPHDPEHVHEHISPPEMAKILS